MKKKLKLKKWVYVFFIIVLFLAIGIYSGLNIYKEYQYKETLEYKLINHGYELEDAKKLQDTFNEEEIAFILSIDFNENIIKLSQEKYFLKKNLKNYLAYIEKNKKKALNEVVRDINVHLDNDFYSLNLKADPSLDQKVLVNKFYLLDSSFEPDDLVSIPVTYAWGELGSKKIRKVAYEAFLEMWNEAKNAGYYLMINSAYRSYQDQEKIYTDLKDNRGEKYADSIASRPGASEYQTGLCMNIFSKNNSNQKTFGDSEEAQWLKNNAYKFGFIERYPKGKENITGFNSEPWRYRYVGKDISTYCYENDITLEEYYAYFIEK